MHNILQAFEHQNFFLSSKRQKLIIFSYLFIILIIFYSIMVLVSFFNKIKNHPPLSCSELPEDPKIDICLSIRDLFWGNYSFTVVMTVQSWRREVARTSQTNHGYFRDSLTILNQISEVVSKFRFFKKNHDYVQLLFKNLKFKIRFLLRKSSRRQKCGQNWESRLWLKSRRLLRISENLKRT